MSGVKDLRKIQFFKEATAGTPGVATAIWRGTGLLDDKRDTVFVPEDIGYLSGVDRTMTPKLLAGLSLDGTPATFEQLPYILAAGVKNVTTGTADGAGSGKIYTYPMPTTSSNTIKTLTAEGGDNQQKDEVEYCFVESFKLSGKGGEALQMSAELPGRQVTPGVSTTGTGIAFVASTKKITDTGNGLAQFATGTTIKVSGSTDNDGVYTVATGGVAGEIVTTEALVDEAAGATVTVEDWFSGGPTGIALPTVEEILFSKGKLYIDAVGGSFGGTLKSNTFMGMDLSVKTGWGPRFAGDGQLYFSRITHTSEAMEVLLNITFEHDGTSVTEKANWRAQTARKIRMLWQGTALGTAGTTYTYKSLIVDLAGKWEKFDKLGDENGNDVVTGTFRARYNATAAFFAQFVVVNELASLP